jgi:hypothetical protein
MWYVEYSYLIIDTRRCLSFQLGRHPGSLLIFLHTFLNISQLFSIVVAGHLVACPFETMAQAQGPG